MSETTQQTSETGPTPDAPAPRRRASKRAAPQPVAERADAPVAVTPERAGAVLRDALAGQSGAPPSVEPAADAEDVAPEREAIEQVLEGDAPAPPKAEPDEPLPQSLRDLAEKLGVEPEALYSVTATMEGDGEPVTLGELKDHYQQSREHALEREAWEMDRQKQAAELAQQREQLSVLAQNLPEQLRTPEMMQRAAAEMEQYRERETAALLEAVPQWKDQAAYQADRELMEAHLEPFGFDARDMDSVLDHRLLAYVRSMALRERRLKDALERGRIGEKRKAPPSRQPMNSPASAGAKRPSAGGARARAARVAQILEGK